MAYTWTNKTKTGGVGLTGKIVQKSKDDFPLMYANDLDWANVEVENGVNLNTTDDLLDYIKGGNSDIIGRIDELELSNAGYEIRCDKSVCYVGDIVGLGYQNQKLPVSIYKNGTLLSWTNAYTEGITFDSNNFTKPSGGNDLIHWSTSDCYLLGEANKAGTYVFNFKKDGVNIASFRFIVLIPAYKSATITVYKSSDTLPLKPVGVSYNFNSDPASINVGESGWSTSTSGLTGTIWFCTGHVSESNPSTVYWNEPCIYLNSEIVTTENEYRVKEVALYKACCGPYTDSNSNTHAKVIPAAPTSTHCYTFNINPANDQFTAPSGWHETPEAAIELYKNNLQIVDLKTNYRVWKTYNSYRITVNKLTDPNTLLTDSYSETGWINPVEYLNIDQILEDTKTYSQRIFDTAIQRAKNDLQQAENLATIIDAVNVLFAWRIVGDGNNSLPSEYTELVDDNDTTSAQHLLYDTFTTRYTIDGVYDGHLEMMNDDDNICTPSYQMKAVRFTHIRENDVDKGYKWVAYIPTTTEIRNQISALDTQTLTLSTAVSAMNPDEIRLQVSKGFKKDVTWTEVDVNEWSGARTVMEEDPDDDEYDFWYYGVDMNTRSKRHGYKLVNGVYEAMYARYDSISDSYDYISGLPVKADTNNGGYVYGHYYVVYKSNNNNDCKYFRCDYPVSTGFANVLADRVSFGVTNNLNGNDNKKGALVNMTVDGVAITGDKIVLDGDAIADAIYGKSLNINNTTYLNTDGSAFFGVPNSSAIINPSSSSTIPVGNNGQKSTRFNTDGSGQLCGGNINWTNNGILYVKEAHIGESGSDWLIKTANNLPTIYSKDNSTNQELFITPQYLNAVKNSTTYWAIQRDGYARFAQGRAEFSPTGVFHLGGLPNTQTTSGKQDGYIDFDPEEGTLTIGGDNVVINAVDTVQIGTNVANTLKNDNSFKGVIISAVGTQVKGDLNTDDLSVGNGSCFFKGSSTAHDPSVLHGRSYGAGTAGAGHLANGNIWWDNEGNLSIGGQLRLKGTSLEWGGAVQYYEFIHHGTFGGYDHGSTGEYAYSEHHYKLPDPKEYLGREVFVEVFIDETEMQTLADAYDPNDSYIGRYVPSFEIESNNENHKWIRWGGDACTYVSCDISRDPKFYKLGNPNGVYTGSGNLVHSIGDSDRTALNPAFMMNSAELSSALTGVGGNSQVECKGLYLIPTPVKWFQIEGSLDPLYEGGNMRLRMRCQAKRLDFMYNGTGEDTDRYYWEIQSTDFMPCFMVGSYNSSIQFSYTNQTLHNETKSSFRTTCEDVVAATGLAFDL